MAENAKPNFATMTKEELSAYIGTLAAAGDIDGIQAATSEWRKAAKAREEAERAAKETLLKDVTEKVKIAIDQTIEKLVGKLPDDVLKAMDGVWYSKDFGAESATCRVVKTAAPAKGTGTKRGEGSGAGSYVSVDVKSSELLEKVGSHVYFAEETGAKIEGVDVTFAAGTTLKEAWDYSHNGGWRNRIRMALLKEAGMLPAK
ncbi:MAG: hypothetical protein WC291_12130 [Thermodesulfovibrionales bacterium]|jgi:hypothetical protein